MKVVQGAVIVVVKMVSVIYVVIVVVEVLWAKGSMDVQVVVVKVL